MSKENKRATRHGERLLALQKILEVCHTETWSHAIKVRRITTIAEANLRGKSSKP